jgi:hypothetical protein
MNARWLLAVAIASCCVFGSLAACPAQGFDSMTDLDLSKFLQGAWYSQQQVRAAFGGSEGLHH